MAVIPSILFALVRVVCGGAGIFLDPERAFGDGDADVADGNRAGDTGVLFLVLCRGVAPYSGRRNMRANTVSVSDKKENGVASPVQSRIAWGMPLCYSVLRDNVFDCG